MAFSTLANRARMTVLGTPGTGTITLNVPAQGCQSFSQAGLVSGNQVSQAWHVIFSSKLIQHLLDGMMVSVRCDSPHITGNIISQLMSRGTVLMRTRFACVLTSSAC